MKKRNRTLYYNYTTKDNWGHNNPCLIKRTIKVKQK